LEDFDKVFGGEEEENLGIWSRKRIRQWEAIRNI